jgi:hypothetical protein
MTKRKATVKKVSSAKTTKKKLSPKKALLSDLLDVIDKHVANGNFATRDEAINQIIVTFFVG